MGNGTGGFNTNPGGSNGGGQDWAQVSQDLHIPLNLLVDAYGVPTALARRIIKTLGGDTSSFPDAYVSSGDPILDRLKTLGVDGAVRTITGDYVWIDAQGQPHKINLDAVKEPDSGSGVGYANLALAKEKFEYDKAQDVLKRLADEAALAENKRQFDQTFDYNIKSDAAKLGLGYDQLNQQEKQDLRNLAYQYYNSTNDANASRQQALASLIANRNSTGVNLAQTSGDIAATAAKFAANPRDAYADILYQNAVRGPAPFAQTSGPNAQPFADYQSALDRSFQEKFGGVAGDLSRVRGYLDAPIPQEYTTPIQAPQVNLQPQQYGPPAQLQTPGPFYGFNSPEEAQAMQKYFQVQGMLPGNAGGGSMMAGKMDAKSPSPGMMRADPSKHMMETHHITKTHPDGKRETHIINKSKPWEPKDSAPPQLMDMRAQASQMRQHANGGMQMLQEPVVGIGVNSGMPLFTAAENGDEGVQTGPDGIKFTPMPGVSQELDPQRQQAMVGAVTGHAGGGQLSPAGLVSPIPTGRYIGDSYPDLVGTVPPGGMPIGPGFNPISPPFRRPPQLALNLPPQFRGASLPSMADIRAQYARYGGANVAPELWWGGQQPSRGIYGTIPGAAGGAYYGFNSPEEAQAMNKAFGGNTKAAMSLLPPGEQGDLGTNIYGGRATPQDPNGPGGDPRYPASQGTYNQSAGSAPLGNGSYIRDRNGNLTAVANPDNTFSNMYSQVVNGKTVTQQLTPELRAQLAAEMRAADTNYRLKNMRTANPEHYRPFTENIFDYGTNLNNHPLQRALPEWLVHGSTGDFLSYNELSPRSPNGVEATGRYVAYWDDRGNPVYAYPDPNHPGQYQTDASLRASGQQPYDRSQLAPLWQGVRVGNGRGNQATNQPWAATSGTAAPPQLSTRPRVTPSGGGGGGGTSAARTPDKLTAQIVTRLSSIDPQFQLTGDQKLPDPRLLTSPLILAQLQNDQDLYDLVVAAYSKQGISEAKLKSILAQLGFNAPKNFQPSVKLG